MAFKGETILTGAPSTCPDCGTFVLPMTVQMSAAGYYIGTVCNCGPYSRESIYYASRDQAQDALDNLSWKSR